MRENTGGVIAHHLFWGGSGMDVELERLRYFYPVLPLLSLSQVNSPLIIFLFRNKDNNYIKYR